jgi:hypothetical protein
MANIASQRIQREFQEVVKSDEVAKSLIAIELVNNSLLELRGRITGPPDTPYDGGVFHLEIKGRGSGRGAESTTDFLLSPEQCRRPIPSIRRKCGS